MSDLTVGDLKRALMNMDDNLILIYSHDDEGNEFQKVISAPSITYVKKQKDYRFLKIADDDTAKKYPELYEKCVCIN